jgi:hypothetical protein
MDSEAVRLSISFMHKLRRICTFTTARTRDNQPNSACSLQDINLHFSSGLRICKFKFLRKDGWTQAITKVYLWTCCMSSDVSKKNIFDNIVVNEVQQNNAPNTIITLPVLWLQHKELGMKMEHFSDAPIHMLFLGVTKHSMAHVDCLYGKKIEFLNILRNHVKAHQI